MKSLRKKEMEIMKSYDISLKKFSDGRVIIKEYDRSILYRLDGYELVDKEIPRKVKRNSGEFSKENLNRSYQLLIDYALENYKELNTFITLTFAENITDILKANRLFNIWCSKVRRVFPDFKYLGVPEFQKRGAVHYHLMTNLKINNSYGLIILQDGKKNMYDVKFWNYGFSSVFDLSLTDEHFSISAYLTKYFYKDIDTRLFGRKKVLCSRNLRKPTVKRLSKSSREYENYIKYLNKYKKIEKKKNITSAKSYIPNIHITEYT